MSRLKVLKHKVYKELVENPESRGDDYILVMNIWSKVYGINANDSVSQVMRNHAVLGLPGWDSIRRCRQYIQAECPELRADEETEAKRLEEQRSYIEFAMEG